MNNQTILRRVIAPPIFVGAILLAFATMGLYGITQAELKPLKQVPAEYANKDMPKGWWTDPKIIKEGEEIYQKAMFPCAVCHGVDSVPVLKGVRDLGAIRMNRMSDSYWFWRISEGVPYTLMQSFKGFLTEEKIWKVMAFEHQFSHGGKAEAHDHPEIEQRVAEGAN